MPYIVPSTPRSITKEPILNTAEYPTFVDSIDCILAVRIDENTFGIAAIIKICNANTPPKYFGKILSITNGDTTITKIVNIMDIIIIMKLNQ